MNDTPEELIRELENLFDIILEKYRYSQEMLSVGVGVGYGNDNDYYIELKEEITGLISCFNDLMEDINRKLNEGE